MNEETIDPRSEVVLSEGAKKALANRFGGKLPPLSVLAQRYGAESVRNMTRAEEFPISAGQGQIKNVQAKAAQAKVEIPPEVSAQIEGARRNDTIAKTFFTGVSSVGLNFSMANQPAFTSAPGASTTVTEPSVLSTQSKPIIGPKSSRIIGGTGKALFTSLVPGLSAASLFTNTRGAYGMLPEGAKAAIADVATVGGEGLSGFAAGSLKSVKASQLTSPINRNQTALAKGLWDRYAAPVAEDAATQTVAVGRSLLKKARQTLSE